MNEPLEFDGERFTPENVREIWYEHMHRYAFAAEFVAGLEVLDAACGEGYGAAILARSAAAVTAVDNSARTIEHARARYAADNLEFHEADCSALPFEDDRFDCIVSFETIEHLEDQDGMLTEFRRVLRPSGFLLISSPDKAVYSDQQQFDNPHHVRELYAEEFRDLLAAHFPARRMLGQKLMFHSAIWATDDETPGTPASLQTWDEEGLQSVAAPVQRPMYLLAFCAADESALPRPDHGLWLFDDARESVYAHYQHEIGKNMRAGAILAEREQALAERDKALAKAQAALAQAETRAETRAETGAETGAESRPAPRRSWLSRLGLSRRGRG